MISQDQRKLIKEWYLQSLHEQFNPFIKLWIAFNGWYKSKYPNKNDRKAIDLCKNDSDLFTFYQRSFSDKQFCDYLDKLVFELDKKPLENLTRPRDRKLSLNKLEDENGNVSFLDNGSEAFNNYLDIIYQVRCNLFHCEKSPASMRDKLIVEYSYKTFCIIMKQIIDTFAGV